MGTTPATGPSPNRGREMAGLQKISLALKALEEAIPMVGAASEPGAAILKCITNLAKFMQPGSVSPAAERNQLESMLTQNTRNGQVLQQLKQPPPAGGGGGSPGGGGGAGGIAAMMGGAGGP